MKRPVFACVAIFAIAACTPTVVVPVATPTVVVPAALRPRLTPAQVEQLVLGQIHQMEAMAGVVLRAPRVLRITAIAGGPAAPGFDGVTWRVDAEGTFATNHGRGPATVPPATTGHVVIGDADGSITEFGFP
jgi:hypothetical protein